jgi:hypothetical protein
MVCEWFGLKTTPTVFAGLASKPLATVSSGLALKSAATVFAGLASKPVATVSPVWPQNCCDCFLQFGLKTGGDGFSRFGLKTGGRFLG